MNTIMWAKRFWAKFTAELMRFVLWLVLSLSLGQGAWAQKGIDFNPLYVQLSDAMTAAKAQDFQSAQQHIDAMRAPVHTLLMNIPPSPVTQALESALAQASAQLSTTHLEQLAKALFVVEKSTKPVDIDAQRQQFARRVLPVYQKLHAAVQAQDVAQALEHYKSFNRTWTVNEKIVRENSLGHYGKIENAMNFLRIALSSNPPNLSEAQRQSALLGAALQDFKAGTHLELSPDSAQTLPQGITLLQSAFHAMQEQQYEHAQTLLQQFLQAWPIFEGSVRTRQAALYHRVESELPLILTEITAPERAKALSQLITELQSLDTKAHYTLLDAMLVLLREGLEALLIIMALLTALRHTQTRATPWVYTGASVGVVASIAVAWLLHHFLPRAQAGIQREVLEGVMGIVAVVMMLFIGAWLHSKVSQQGWQRFVTQQTQKAQQSGRVWSMAGLAFLAVFREGSETLLFYAGMLPSIRLLDLSLGIVSALLILAVVAFCLHRSSAFLSLPKLFAAMTLCIYILGFKILGVSIHTLQLTQYLPRHDITALPSLPMLGWYSSVEGLVSQALFIVLILLMRKRFT